jgi:hypothetical protein
VRKLDFANPLQPLSLPLSARLFALPRMMAQRRLPLRLSLLASCWTSALRILFHPRLREHTAHAIRAVATEPLDDGVLNRYVRHAIGLRRMGFHTYGPVSGRSRRWLLRSLHVDGVERLDELKAAGHGAVVLGAHFGLDGWVGPVLRGLGYPSKLIQRRRIAPETYLLLKRDGWLDQVLPYPDETSSGPHLKMLHDMVLSGSWVIHVADQYDPQGMQGMLFGREVRCCSAPWVLARLTGAPAVPVLLLADERMRVRMTVGPLLRVPKDAPAHHGTKEAFQTYLDFLTREVRPAPWNVAKASWLPPGGPPERDD